MTLQNMEERNFNLVLKRIDRSGQETTPPHKHTPTHPPTQPSARPHIYCTDQRVTHTTYIYIYIYIYINPTITPTITRQCHRNPHEIHNHDSGNCWCSRTITPTITLQSHKKPYESLILPRVIVDVIEFKRILIYYI